MTYTERMQRMEEIKGKPPSTIGKAVKQVLIEAIEQDRVNYGVFECVDILERDPESVMVVILPDSKVKDASLRIQHTLIEAFCRENEVKVLKVDCATKISTIFTSSASKEVKERTLMADFSCLLIRNPEVFRYPLPVCNVLLGSFRVVLLGYQEFRREEIEKLMPHLSIYNYLCVYNV